MLSGCRVQLYVTSSELRMYQSGLVLLPNKACKAYLAPEEPIFSGLLCYEFLTKKSPRKGLEEGVAQEAGSQGLGFRGGPGHPCKWPGGVATQPVEARTLARTTCSEGGVQGGRILCREPVV